MAKSRALPLALLLGAAIAVAPRVVLADCAPVRPATAEEKTIYADGYALFQRVAPPAPAGWEMSDAQKNGALIEVCAGATEKVIEHRFSRSYALKEGMEARQAEAQKKMAAVLQASQATAEANQAKMADIMKRMQALQAKAQELVAAKKYPELEALGKQQEALQQESMKLMNVGAQEAAMNAIDAEARRDTGAQFSLMLNTTSLSTDDFAPVTVGTLRAFRQLVPAEGASPATADLIVVLNPTAQGPKNALHISGDPARAEALLRAAKLQ